MNSKIKPIIKLALSFLIPFIFLLVIIPKFFTLELTQNSVLALALFAFLIFLVITVYRRVGHQGQLPLWFGAVLVVGALIALAGSTIVSVNCDIEETQTDSIFYDADCNDGKKAFFELSARDQGFSLMGLIAGGIILAFGIKQSTSNAYWWGRGGNR